MIDAEVQVNSSAIRLAALRQCDDLFFSLNFTELSQLSSMLIDQHTEYGDAYAFRCFALLGNTQVNGGGEYGYDLVELLRDYFPACERALATEAATVCRLFLKLVFGELVKRIARAKPGDKFNLQKTDPLCGGAFAVMEGEFEKAEENFARAILEPASRVYGHAGMAMLKLFDSDMDGALYAFSQAGIEDDDITSLAHWLRREARPVLY